MDEIAISDLPTIKKGYVHVLVILHPASVSGIGRTEVNHHENQTIMHDADHNSNAGYSRYGQNVQRRV